MLYLLLIIVAITNNFALLAVQFFFTKFYDGNNPDTNLCNDFRTCLVNVFSVGLQKGGRIGDFMSIAPKLSDKSYFPVFFFVILFFIMINLLLLSAWFGIVIDAFNAYKEELRSRENFQNNICYVCGLKRQLFQRQNLDFDNHIKNEHSIFSYFNLIAYIKNKPKIDFNGTDIYIENLLREKNKNAFFPKLDCFEFQKRKIK